MPLPNYFEMPALAQREPTLHEAVAEFRRRFILSALSRARGDRKRAARALGIGFSTLKALVRGR